MTILQIIPADGWLGVYAERSEETDWYATAYPLAMWALVSEEGGRTRVVGLDAEDVIKPVEDYDNFLGYLALGDNVAVYADAVREYGAAEDGDD